MIERFQTDKAVYPLIAIMVMLLIFIGGLLMARSLWGAVFLLAAFVLLCVSGYGKVCLRFLPILLVYAVAVYVIFYFAGKMQTDFAMQMTIRLTGVLIAAIPGLAMEPVKLVRALTKLRFPRLLTLGMLITMSFIPILAGEIRQVRDAMKTRGILSIWNVKAFYRAFLIPLIVRLVNISDTLALSVETRGFISEDGNYTIFHPVTVKGRDIGFLIAFLAVFAFCLAGTVSSWQPWVETGF